MKADASVSAELGRQLRAAGLDSALFHLNSVRVRSYFKRPGAFLRDGWNVTPGKSLKSPARYSIGDHQLGQSLRMDQKLGLVTLVTHSVRAGYRQVIQLCLASGVVEFNRTEKI